MCDSTILCISTNRLAIIDLKQNSKDWGSVIVRCVAIKSEKIYM